MKLELLDIERLIEVNNLREVTSHHLFSNKMMYDPEGILSNEIFGISKNDRRTTFAYIDLKRPYIHPQVYKNILVPLYKNIKFIISGQHRYVIKDGFFVKDDVNGWTGLTQLYNHWGEIDWDKKQSANAVGKNVLKLLSRDQVFITKMLVCPPAYRDVTLAGTFDSSDHVSELNDKYTKLIRSVSLVSEGGIFAATQYSTQMAIENLLVEILVFFQNIIAKKYGIIRQSLIGKNVDYGVRAVISAPSFNYDRIEDAMVDIEHTALPISQACSTFYPFIQAWLKNFFTREIINDPNVISFYDQELKHEVTASIADPEIQFSERNLKKMIDDYCLNPDNRFRVITVQVTTPTKKGDKISNAVLVLKGKVITDNNTSSLLHRPMTVADVLYLACVDVCEKRHLMVSRYPVGTDKGIILTKIRIQSTARHVHVVFNGKDYPNYPEIDLKLADLHSMVGVQFIDTLVISNSHLDGMGADYDGDQVSVRGLWTDEANEEAEKIMYRKMSALTIAGTNSKSVAKEVFNSLFELTKIGPNPKPVKQMDVDRYLQMNPNGFTRTLLTQMFADTVNATGGNVAGKHKAYHQTWDTMTVPANHFYEGQPAIKTTIGRYVANKFILQASGVISACGYKNVVWDNKATGSINDEIGDHLQQDHINRTQFNQYLDHRDHLGYWLNGMLAHTISEKMLKPLPQVEKLKAELCKKYEKELAAGDIDVMNMISDQLVSYAKELLKDDPGMDLYTSGDLDFANNYKNNSILKGAVLNQLTGEFDFIGSSFMDGIEIKDIPAHANSILASQYPASIATADAGYMGKELLAMLQMMEVDYSVDDCGTKNLIPVTVTNANKNNLIYSYIDNNGQLLLLNKDNINQFVGKTVMMRSPMTCLNDKICAKCAGELFRMLEIEHAGLFAVQISHADLNLALKSKHNSVVNLYSLDPDSLICDV